ncbi:MAG: glycoside hydrolase family 15 protein [Nocardioidaceae bacterium]
MYDFAPHVLRAYALLADGERGVVVGPRGEFAFLCFPGWADPALFSALLGGRGGYAVSPAGDDYVWGGYYEDGSLVWRSRWATRDAIVESREALAMPSSPDRAVVLRRVEAVSGDAVVRVVIEPVGEFGQAPLRDLHRDDQGAWTGRCDDIWLRWTGGHAARVDDGAGLVLDLPLREGQHHDLVLELALEPFTTPVPDPEDVWTATERAWAATVPQRLSTWAERDVRHAYAVLHGLTSASGAMVAAATTSLPERARAGRNYDYRYAWIRDQAITGQAVARHGSTDLLDAATRFVTERLLADGPRLRPAYTVEGGRVPSEQTLDLPGYPGSRAVVGNAAGDQFQVDAFGEVLHLYAAAAGLDRLDHDRWAAAELAVEALATRRHEPDAGIWELRTAGRWAHSQLIAVSGLRAIAPFAPSADRHRWLDLADTILREVSADCRHPSGRWQRSPSDPRVDAALLLPIIRGAVPVDDPTTVATVGAILADLGDQHYLYRFRHDDRALADSEGAFVLCGFLAAQVLGQLGDHVEAARWFERNRAACGPPGLLTEEFDVTQRQLRGNLPQAFVHALLIEAGASLAAAP